MKKLIKNITAIIKPYKYYQILGFIFTIFYTIAVFLSPMVSKYLIDKIIPSNSLSKLKIGLCIFYGGCIVQPIFGYLKDKVFMYITENVTSSIRKKMFFKVIHAPMEFFDKSNNGAIISRISNDGRSASQFITNFFVVFIKNILLIIMIVIGMLYLSLEITSIVLLLYVIYFCINWRLSNKFQGLSLEMQKSYDDMCIKINHTISSINTIKAYMIEEKEKNEFSDIINKTYKNNIKYRSLSILINTMGNVIMITSLSIVYGIGALFVMQGKISLGTVVAIGLYFQMLVQPVYELLGNNIDINTTMPIFERIDEYFNLKSENLKRSNTIIEKIETFELKNIQFKYTNGVQALDAINLCFPEKGMFAIVGESGGGKSTLIKIMDALYNSYDGVISINGLDINKFSVNEIREKISLVSQDTELLNKSIYENLKGNMEIGNNQVLQILEKLNLRNTIEKLDDGYHTIINERINLSGGERQRLSIARAFLKESLIYIFDEPTAALDTINEMKVKRLLEELAKDKLVILITHNINLLNRVECIYVMKGGKIVEEGNYNDLVDKHGYFYEFLNKRGIKDVAL